MASRRRPSLSAWSTAGLGAWAVLLALFVLEVSGLWKFSDWLYLAVWAVYAAVLLFPHIRPARWRVTDDRRPSWAEDDDR